VRPTLSGTDVIRNCASRCLASPSGLGRIFGSPEGEPDRQQYAEFEFPDRAAFDRGMGSPEMGAVVEDAQTQGIPFHVYFVEAA
jgi:hypothetical protein